MRVLITGGTGFIGGPLADALVQKGNQILVYDAFPNANSLGGSAPKVEIVKGDVNSGTDLYDAIKRFDPDAIIHLAAFISQYAEAHPTQAVELNIRGTVTVFEIAKKLDVTKIIIPSTVATFNSSVQAPISDDEVQRPATVYGITKVFCELWGTYFHNKYNFDFRSVRLPSIIGPGRTNGGASVYASLMIEMPAKGMPYEALASPGSSIPLLYIQDAVGSLTTLLEAKDCPRTVYNVSGIVPTASEISAEVKRHIPGAKITFKSDPTVVRMLKQWQQMDSSNFEKDLGWKIRYPLDKLIEDFIAKVRLGSKNQ